MGASVLRLRGLDSVTNPNELGTGFFSFQMRAQPGAAADTPSREPHPAMPAAAPQNRGLTRGCCLRCCVGGTLLHSDRKQSEGHLEPLREGARPRPPACDSPQSGVPRARPKHFLHVAGSPGSSAPLGHQRGASQISAARNPVGEVGAGRTAGRTAVFRPLHLTPGQTEAAEPVPGGRPSEPQLHCPGQVVSAP